MKQDFGILPHFRVFMIIVLMTFLCSSFAVAQQKGSISGRITDQSDNEPLIGTNVLVVGTTLGAASDLDGNYKIKNLPPGTYRLRFTYISYQTITVDKVVVEMGKDTQVNIALPPAALELRELVVAAEALRTSEFSVLSMQRNADHILDGVSAEMISKNNSSDGTDVLKRMSGVTISDGKFAIIRGVGDRYNNTLLNGSSLPSTDPEKKSFSYDFFPANLIESLNTAKTATPDKPADFSGGLIEMKTIEFPASMIFNLSLSSSYDPQTQFKDFVGYNGGKQDIFGFDDGTRSLPEGIGTLKVGKGNYTTEELRSIGLAFRNNWQTTTTQAPMRGSMKLSLGNSYGLSQHTMLGYIASLNYSNTDVITELEKNNYTFDGPRYEYKGTDYANSVAWSGMLNMSLKFSKSHKISLKNLYNHNAENETVLYEGPSYYFPDYRKSTSLRFVSRSLYSTQLIGEHHLPILRGLGISWNLNYGQSERNEPDVRNYVYNRDLYEPDASFRFLLDQSLSTRFFGYLDDTHRGASTDFSLKVFKNPALPNFKFGVLYDKMNRAFDARTFGFWNVPGGNFIAEDQLMTAPIEDIFASENFGNRFIEVIEMTKAADSYASDQYVAAAYLMTSFNPLAKFKVVTGLRLEKSQQNLDSYTITNEPVTVKSTYNDWLPSMNLTYAFSPKSNLRAAVSKTLARPEFRELAPFSYFDFVNYELIEGNPNLKRTLISNYDLRFEFFPSNLELLAISAFYKKFDDPIEQILLAASAFQPIRSFENADKATNYGLELEVKKGLGFVYSKLEPFSFVGNLSLIQSEINLKGKNVFQEDKRPLQGQADYITNLGLYYDDLKGRLTVSLIYNRVGERIHSVGFANLGDVIELPRDQIDFTLSKKLFNQISLKISAKDLLNQDHKFIQRTLQGDKTAELRKTGRMIAAGLSYQL